MFGALVASRPVLTNLETISPTQFTFTIPTSPPFSHIVVFLLPGYSFPPGTAAGIYVRIPPADGFRLLGGIGNGKQSGIFKIDFGATRQREQQQQQRDVGIGGDAGGGDDVMRDEDGEGLTTTTSTAGIEGFGGADITLGISIEAAELVEAQVSALRAEAAATRQRQVVTASTSGSGLELVKHQQHGQGVSAEQTKVLAQRIIKNAFNYLSSFVSGSGGSEAVPLKAFQDWWTKFEGRIERDPGFLEREPQV